jgi:hypothetical protein
MAVALDAAPPMEDRGVEVDFLGHESRLPTEWEKMHFPIILLTSEDWNPTQEVVLQKGRTSKASNLWK